MKNTRLRQCICRFVFAAALVAAPAWAAEPASRPDSEYHAAYCYGAHLTREKALGDECIDAIGGFENECSADIRAKNQFLAGQSLNTPGNGAAALAGENDYQQCMSEVSSDAGVAQTLECKKHYTGQQLTACISSGPATPACGRMQTCEE